MFAGIQGICPDVALIPGAGSKKSLTLSGWRSRNPDRVLFGTDCVAPSRQQQMLDVFQLYEPVWKLLTPEASRKVRLENHERLFDEAKRRTRAWEHQHVSNSGTRAAAIA